MRSHLLQCIEKGEMKPFPASSGREHKQPAKEVIPIYCTCRLIDDGTRMIECAQCREWYHVGCVDVEKKYITKLKLDWFCESCAA